MTRKTRKELKKLLGALPLLGLVAGLDTRSFNDRVALMSCPPGRASGSLEHKLKMEKIKLVLDVIVYIYVFWRSIYWLRNQINSFFNGLKSIINVFAKKFEEMRSLQFELKFPKKKSKFPKKKLKFPKKNKKNSSLPTREIDD